MMIDPSIIIIDFIFFFIFGSGCVVLTIVFVITATQEVIDLMRKNQYQLACSKVFEIKHKAEFAVNHPNAYFDESQRLLRGKTNKEPTSAVKQSKFWKVTIELSVDLGVTQ